LKAPAAKREAEQDWGRSHRVHANGLVRRS
jgi:hypothetical protein